jgi:hypothetical protein
MDENERGPVEMDEMALVREVVLKAHPDVVPELVSGATVAELLASVEPARAAHARIIEALPKPVAEPPVVPAGAATAVVDPAGLPAHELIRRGIAAKRTRGTGVRG